MAQDVHTGAKSARDSRPLVEFNDVHKKLKGRPILDGLTFDVRRGETFVIIGYSGTGKSVTLKNLLGLMKPDSGSIRVEGDEVTTMKPRELEHLRRKFGVLFQSGALINWLSVYENVELPLLEHTRHGRRKRAEIVQEKLELVNLWKDRDKTPAEISGGMKKRAGLARAIALDPEIVLYDEPSSGLDPVIANEIDKLINALRERLGMTSIVVTHDMDSAYEIASRIGMFYHGKMIQIGTPQEIQRSMDPEVQHFITGGRSGALSFRSRAAVEAGKPPVFSIRQPTPKVEEPPSGVFSTVDSNVYVLEDVEQASGNSHPRSDETEKSAPLPPPRKVPESIRAEVEAARARTASLEVRSLGPAQPPLDNAIPVTQDLPELAPEPHNEAGQNEGAEHESP